MNTAWNLVNVKYQLRLTAQRLGQLQEKKDSKGSITRRDIATLLQQGNVGLARAKARNLILEDASGDLLEALEMHVGLILEHIGEIDARTPSPSIVEAASSIIFAAPHTESRDLAAIRETLMQQLGPDFSRSAIKNRDNHVSPRIIRALSNTPPSASSLNYYLLKIANAYSIPWKPEPFRQDILVPLSEILDPTSCPTVDLALLRKLCARGVPDQPSWLRPRIWKLFFGILPTTKSSWRKEMNTQRESYYELIRRLLGPFSDAPPPTTPLSATDAALMTVFKQFSRIPAALFSELEDEPEPSALVTPDESLPSSIMSKFGSNLDVRLHQIQEMSAAESSRPQATPEIRLEAEEGHDGTPGISLTTPESFSSRRENVPTTLLPSKAYNTPGASEKHTSAMIRLLYLHFSINPGNHSPHIPALIVPIYSVLMQEIDPEDFTHAEADAFWLFEAMVAEFSELEDEDGGNLWMKHLGDRVLWADDELAECLHDKGLDPALPHYSYRWLAPLLTQTLPLSSVLLVWDALFACPKMERDHNPKLDHLINICTAMLLRAKSSILRLGKSDKTAQGLWVTENHDLPPPSPMRAWELGDAFLEGMALLQRYPVNASGGIDILLQTASDLAQQREAELRARQTANNTSLGSRLKVSWKGFGYPASSSDPAPSPPPPSHSAQASKDVQTAQDTGHRTKPSGSDAISSRIASTVWKGISNESSMEVPPTPISPTSHQGLSIASSSKFLSPQPRASPEDTSPVIAESSSTSLGIWDYAEKLKDSDTAAALAKVSSNWRAKAIGSWGIAARYSAPVTASAPVSPVVHPAKLQSVMKSPVEDEAAVEDNRRGSLPVMDRTGIYSPPARPAFFRPPRDSMIVNTRASIIGHSFHTSPEITSPPENFINRTKNLLARPPAAKSGPRPLLLNSSSLITTLPPSNLITRSATSTPAPNDPWADVALNKSQRHLPRDSQSSMSSFSPSPSTTSKTHAKSRSDWESDSAILSRKIPLNRHSISPMAPAFPHGRKGSTSSSTTSSDVGSFLSPITAPALHTSPEQDHVNILPHRNWGRVELQDSPVPQTPVTLVNDSVHVSEAEEYQEPMFVDDTRPISQETPSSYRKLSRSSHSLDSGSDSSVILATPSRAPRTRSKRYPTRPANLKISDSAKSSDSKRSPTTNSLTVDSPDIDLATTPRASKFDDTAAIPSSPRRARKISTDESRGLTRVRKVSADGSEGRPRVRKVSTGSTRTRKISTEGKDTSRRVRDSHAADGDDEYDDLLSAYESEV